MNTLFTNKFGYVGLGSYIYPVLMIKIKVMFKTDAVIDLWVGINGGYITVDEYYEMLNLLN